MLLPSDAGGSKASFIKVLTEEYGWGKDIQQPHQSVYQKQHYTKNYTAKRARQQSSKTPALVHLPLPIIHVTHKLFVGKVFILHT